LPVGRRISTERLLKGDDMNVEKFTERAQFHKPRTRPSSTREGHQQCRSICSKAILDDSEHGCEPDHTTAGGAPDRVRQAVDISIAKHPGHGGDTGQVYLSRDVTTVWMKPKGHKKAGDSCACRARVSAFAVGEIKGQGTRWSAMNALSPECVNDVRKGAHGGFSVADTLGAEQVCRTAI
jgi:ATP-dependent Clp protease ATP-binding subunit ClpB